MKKTLFIELLKTIRKTKVSFLSIAFFVMLGTTAYLGVSFAVQGFSNTFDNALASKNFKDIEIRYPYGLSDEYIEEFKSQPYIDYAEGEYSTNQCFKYNNSTVQGTIKLLSNEINKVEIIEGTLPKTYKECAIEKFYADRVGIKIGDVIELIHDDDGSSHQLNAIVNNDLEALKQNNISDDGMAYLNNDKYKVTALVNASEHLSKYEGTLGFSDEDTPINVLIYVTKDAFDEKAFPGYTKVTAVCNSLRNYVFNSSEYEKQSSIIADKVEAFSKEYIDLKNKQVLNNKEDIKKQIYDEILNGEKDIIDGRKKIADGELEIIDGEKAIADGKIELDKAKKKLQEAESEVADGWDDYYYGLEEYNNSKSLVTSIQNVYDAVDDVVNEIINIYENAKEISGDINSKIASIKQKYDSIKHLIDSDYASIIAVEKIFDYLDTNREDIDTYLDAYNNFLEYLKTNDGLPSKEDINNEFDLLIADLDPSNPNRTILEKLRNEINEVYDELAMIEDIPNLLITTYDLLKAFGLVEDAEQELIDEIRSVLTEYELETLSKYLDDIEEIIQTNFSSYDDIKLVIDTLFNKLGIDIYEVQEYLHNTINPIIEKLWDKLADAKNQLNDGLKELKDAEKEISKGWDEYNDASNLIIDKEKELINGKAELAKGKLELTKAENDLVEGKNLYKKYVDATKDIKAYDAVVVEKSSNITVITAKCASQIIENLKYTMGILFVLVGIFVSYSAMSRLVHDQTVYIGTKKALGFNQGEITISYIVYAIIATIFGSILGIIFSRYVIEPIIVYVIADSFICGEFKYFFGLEEYLIFTAVEMIITVAAAYLASRNILKRKAKELLDGGKEIVAKSRFYERSIIWDKLSLLTKTIINNGFNDTRRVFGTVVGITGCVSLLVCSIAFRNNVDESILKQINELVTYDTYVYIDKSNDQAKENITKELDKLNVEYTGVLIKSSIVKDDDGSFVCTSIYTSQEDDYHSYKLLRKGNKELKPTNGVIISEAYCKKKDLEVGDNITIIDSKGNEHVLPIDGTNECYTIDVDIDINKDVYEKEFNESVKDNVLFIRRGNYSLEEIKKTICDCDGYLSIIDYKQNVLETTRAITLTSYAIFGIFLALSTALALLVILNLLVMFVDEKKKELVILMINGYERKFAKKYIYTDTIFLTAISLVIGSLFGSIAGIYTTRSMDTDMSYFMTSFYPRTYVFASLIAILLCILTSIIALRRINKFKLTDINAK